MSGIRIAAAAGALLLLGVAIWRWRSGRPARAALASTGCLLLTFFAFGGSVAVPDGENAVQDAAASLGQWTYPFAAAMAFLETAIPPVTVVFPGEWLLLLCGAIAAVGEVELLPLLAITWVFSAAGDSFVFALGRRLGRPFLLRRGPSFGLTPARIERIDLWIDRWGAPGVCVGRLLPLARPFGPFIAGASRLPYRRFLAWNLLGTLLFTLVFCLLGYVFYRSYDELAKTIGQAAFVALGVLLAAVVATVLIRRRRRRGRTPAPRPAVPVPLEGERSRS